MDFPVAETIRKVGFTKLHRASGIPMRTLFRWAAADKVPGKSDLQRDARTRMLAEAIEKAGGEVDAPKRKKRTG